MSEKVKSELIFLNYRNFRAFSSSSSGSIFRDAYTD